MHSNQHDSYDFWSTEQSSVTGRIGYYPHDRETAAVEHQKGDSGQVAPLNAHALLGIGASEYRVGRPREALEPLLEACRRLAAHSDRNSLMEALLLAGRAERDLGLLEDAARHFDEALCLARSEGQRNVEVDALNLQAGLLGSQGDGLGALEHLEEALETARVAELPECQANILNNIGNLSTQLGDFARARHSLQSALAMIMRMDPRSRTAAVSLINLGHLCQDLGDQTEAQEYYARAREIGREINDQMIEIVSINNLANALGRSGEWTAARELYHQALEKSRHLRFRRYEMDNLDGLGQAHSALGEYERAAGAHLQALAIARKISDPEGKVDALVNLGRNYLALNRPDQALTHLTEGLDHARWLERKPALIEAHELLAQVHEQLNDPAAALRHQRELNSVEKAVLNDKCEWLSKQLASRYATQHSRRENAAGLMQASSRARDGADARLLARTRELERAQREIVSRLASAVEYRDYETGEHTRRVGRHSAAIARALGWPEEDVELLSWAARLHDLGKIGIRDAILLKPDKLTSEELELVQAHTEIGAKLLSGGRSRLLRMAEEIALSHHERWDGNGYPHGLAGNEIPMSARIVAVADTYDALVHERPYKRPWSTREALSEIMLQSGSQFDPQVVAAFLAVCKDDGHWATWGLLTKGSSKAGAGEIVLSR